jgi:hypothetical protein
MFKHNIGGVFWFLASVAVIITTALLLAGCSPQWTAKPFSEKLASVAKIAIDEAPCAAREVSSVRDAIETGRASVEGAVMGWFEVLATLAPCIGPAIRDWKQANAYFLDGAEISTVMLADEGATWAPTKGFLRRYRFAARLALVFARVLP